MEIGWTDVGSWGYILQLDIVVGRESGYLKIFFYISRGEHVKHFVIDVYL
jgi:hypothetical protein